MSNSLIFCVSHTKFGQLLSSQIYMLLCVYAVNSAHILRKICGKNTTFSWHGVFLDNFLSHAAFSAAAPSPLFRTCRPCRGRAHGPSPTPDCVRCADLSGVNKISPLRGECKYINNYRNTERLRSRRRLAIFAVKKLCRFEREKTRTVRSTANGVRGASFRVLARSGQF